jgi:butyrate kinase
MEVLGILAINPGSTSTKIAVYHSTTPKYIKTLKHSAEELKQFSRVADQFEFRKNAILNQLKEAEVKLHVLRAIVGRGGLLKPIRSGVYEVNDQMKHDLLNSPNGEHASNLGGLIAADLADSLPGTRAFIADPIVVDELEDIARFAGHPLFKRISIFHALNQKAVARNHAKSVMKRYEDLNLIVAHLGGGITVGAHRKGRVIDVNQGLDGEGPFAPERSGTLPVGDLVRLCFSGLYKREDVLRMIKGGGGLVAYTGTNDAYEVELKAQQGDAEARRVLEAMAYQVSKEIGAMYAVLHCEVDAILITGGIANSKWFVNEIMDRVHRLAPVFIYPGEDEMEALAMNGFNVITGACEAQEYK